MQFGVDCAASLSAPGGLKPHGVSFVCRYLSPPGNAKNITKAEAARIHAAGLDLVLVWEQNGDEPITGHAATGAGASAGILDARLAEAEARAVGVPSAAPIFFALDRDPSGLSAAEWAAVDGYFKGVRQVLGKGRVGAYGGYALIKHLFDKRLIDYGWQTYAWSGGHWDARAHLRQYLNAQTLAGVSVDFDHALTVDYGQVRKPVEKPPIKYWRIVYRNRKGQFKEKHTKTPVRFQLLHPRVKRNGKLIQEPIRK